MTKWLDAPTGPGWWWFDEDFLRTWNRQSPEQLRRNPHIVYVRQDRRSGAMFIEDGRNPSFVKHNHGRWCGPITPPPPPED